MEQTFIPTPIEKAIDALKKRQVLLGLDGLQSAIDHLEVLLPYEKTYHRNIAEKAWDACQKWNDFIDDDGTLGEIIHNKMPFDREDFIKKQLKL